MSTPTQQKVCPSCGKVNPLQARTCDTCQHVFRTYFAPPEEQTRMVSSAPPESTALAYTPPPAPAARSHRWRYLGGAVAGFVLLLLIVRGVIRTGANDVAAWETAKVFVTDSLRSPSTATFPTMGEGSVQNLGGRRFRVSGYVDSQNGFGAMIRTQWVCTVQYQSGGDWLMKGLSLDGEVLKYDDTPAPYSEAPSREIAPAPPVAEQVEAPPAPDPSNTVWMDSERAKVLVDAQDNDVPPVPVPGTRRPKAKVQPHVSPAVDNTPDLRALSDAVTASGTAPAPVPARQPIHFGGSGMIGHGGVQGQGGGLRGGRGGQHGGAGGFGP